MSQPLWRSPVIHCHSAMYWGAVGSRKPSFFFSSSSVAQKPPFGRVNLGCRCQKSLGSGCQCSISGQMCRKDSRTAGVTLPPPDNGWQNLFTVKWFSKMRNSGLWQIFQHCQIETYSAFILFFFLRRITDYWSLVYYSRYSTNIVGCVFWGEQWCIVRIFWVDFQEPLTFTDSTKYACVCWCACVWMCVRETETETLIYCFIPESSRKQSFHSVHISEMMGQRVRN